MSLKMSSPWKHPKTGVYWIRRRVPAHLIALVGRSEEKQSLRTKDPVEAKRAFSLAMAAIEERWANLERGVHTLSPRESVNLARVYYDGMIDEFRDQPLLQTKWDVEIGAMCFQPNVLATSVGLAVDEREVRRTIMESWCRDFAGVRLSQSGVPVTGENVEILARSICGALQAAALELKRLSSVSAFSRLPGAAPSLSAVGDNRIPSPKLKPVPAEDIFNGWAGERRPNQKTLYTYERVLEAFMEFVGEDDVAVVTQKNAADWKADLLGKGLSPKTIAASKLGALRAIFQWATDNGKVPANPFSNVSITVKKKPGERRRGYSDDEAALVLRAAEKEESAHRRWVPLLCAYTGARVSEVSQLRKQDVTEHFGPEIDGRGRLVPHRSRGQYSQLRNAIYGGEPGPANATRSGPSTTAGVTAYDAQKLYFAMAFAAWCGSYLNCHIVVTWSLVGVVADKDVATAHQRLMDLVRRWLQRGGSEGHFVWVIERGLKRGLHSHILLRMKPQEAFELRQWLYRAIARISRKNAVPKTTLFLRPTQPFSGKAQWKFWAKYFLKGSDGTWLLKSVAHTKEGTFTGKRVGVSRSLDESVQRSSPDFPRDRASLRTVIGDPFDGRFDEGQFLVDLERDTFKGFPPGPLPTKAS